MKKVRKWLGRAERFFLTPVNNLRDYLRYREAVIMADEAHAKDSDRYYVMPSMDGKLLVMDRKNFRRLKRKGYIHKNATMQNAIRECFYYTPGLANAGVITEDALKRKYAEYKKWCKAMRMIGGATK